MNYVEIQTALQSRGYYHGRIDGIYGPQTRLAIIEFKQSQGLPGTAYLSQGALNRLLHVETKVTPKALDVPWVNEIGRYLGLHERFHNWELRTWLKSDGRTLGDPAVYPWCGDAVQTSLALALPDDELTGRVDENPYLARNWLDYGQECEMGFGAVVILWRGHKGGMSGHVAFLMGQDKANKKILLRGGNQSNRVSDVWVDEERVLGYRKPMGCSADLPPVPQYDASGAIVSENEA